MDLRLYKTVWGHGGSTAEAIDLALEAGFCGIEAPAPEKIGARKAFFSEIETSGVEWIAEVSTCTPEGEYVPEPGRSSGDHLASLEEGVVRSLEGSPRFVNTMGGYDAWSHDEAMRFHEGVVDLESRLKVPISVETHRGRSTYSPWLTRDLLRSLPDLKLTCDFSHWCVVSERLILDEEPEILELAAERAFHIQPRVGYGQGPQVPDPRAPEHEADLAAHERWWDRLIASMRERGMPTVTMTPEFGPDGYLHCAPYTLEPVADLWEINRWIGLRQKERFEENSPSKSKI